jgi:HlyD family secretion protein
MYRFAEITRGNVQTKVSASGKFDAVGTAQVGTQVSGQIAEIHVDFNDRVKKEEVITKVDPILAQQAVREADDDFTVRNQTELAEAAH